MCGHHIWLCAVHIKTLPKVPNYLHFSSYSCKQRCCIDVFNPQYPIAKYCILNTKIITEIIYTIMLRHVYRDLSLLLLIILICICVSIHEYCAYECIYVCSPKQGIISSGAGILGGCEPPNVGPRNWTLVLREANDLGCWFLYRKCIILTSNNIQLTRQLHIENSIIIILVELSHFQSHIVLTETKRLLFFPQIL